MARVSFKFELVSREADVLPNLQGLRGAFVTIRARDGSAEGYRKGGTIREVNDIGIQLVSPTGTHYGFPWEAIERIEVA